MLKSKVYPRSLTASLPLKNDGWKTIRLPVGLDGNFSGASCQALGGYHVRELPPKSRSSTHKTFPGTALPPGTSRLNLLNFPLQPQKKAPGARCISKIEISKSILGRFPHRTTKKNMFWRLHGGTKQPTNIVYYTYSP